MSSEKEEPAQVVDHRLVFAVMMASFFVSPYLVAVLRIPYSRLDYPSIWLWGLLLFGLVSYLMGSTFSMQRTAIRSMLNNQGKLRAIVLFLVLSLSWFYLIHLGLTFIQSILGSVLIVAFWAMLIRRRFDRWTSTILTATSLSAMILSFLTIGGIPLLNPDILGLAKLSAAREFALPLFLLGGISFFFNTTTRSGIVRYGLSIAIFAIGGLIFLLNGDFHDLLAILLACLFAVLSICSRKRKILAIGSLALIGLCLSYLVPSILGLFRQSFNLQVLRHITLLVEDPITGLTKGAITFGLKRDFLGAHLIYGEDENWTLTSTWLGPAYLDLGLIGVFLTMFTLGAILEFTVEVLGLSGGNINLTALYLATLSIIVSLFEDGASLPVMIFLLLVTYGALCQLPKGKSCLLDPKRETPRKGLVISILATSLVGLGLSAYAYCSEFGGLRRSVHIEAITKQRTQVALILVPNRFYHGRIVGPGTVCLNGDMTVISDAGGTQNTLGHTLFKGCLWEAKVDQIDLGWFRTDPHESRYGIVLDISEPPGSSSQIYLKIETSDLSFWITNETAIQVAIGMNAIALILLAICGQHSGINRDDRDSKTRFRGALSCFLL